MNWFKDALDFVLHLDTHLGELIRQYGVWFYGILFLTIFAETGLVIMPFLPGDSLLFACGVLAANPEVGLNLWLSYFLIIAAAFCGDNVNYWLGRTLGRRFAASGKSRIFRPESIQKTHDFLDKHGRKAIIMARFVPIVRTFMPFVAGMGSMEYREFMGWSLIASFIWVSVCLLGGYFFGGIPAVRDNFEIAVLAIIAVTLIPVAFEIYKHKRNAAKAKTTVVEAEPESEKVS